MTERPFEQLLERCLQEVAHTGDVESVLRHYPRHADHLRPLLEMALATSHTYADVPEPPGGLAAGRRWLLDTAAQQRERARATKTPNTDIRKERKPKMKLLFATRLISAILAVAMGTAAVGGGVTWAASDSLPGETLYPVKLTSENVRLSLASTPQNQVELALQFAGERVAEMAALVDEGQPIPEHVVARMERHIVQAMNQAARASEEDMPGLLERIAQRTRAQVQALEQLRTRAQEQNQARLQDAQHICQGAQEGAMAGLGDPQTFRLRYQHRENMPEGVTPPEPPTNEPQSDGQGHQGPGEPGQGGTPRGDQDQEHDRQQDQDPERDRQQDQQQDHTRDRQQDQTGNQQQDRDRDRDQEGDQQQDRTGDQQQDQDRDQQQDRTGDQQQDQDRDQQQEQQQEQDRDQQQEQQPDPQPNQRQSQK